MPGARWTTPLRHFAAVVLGDLKFPQAYTRGPVFAIHRNFTIGPTLKRAKTETSESASTAGDTQGVSTPVAMDNADSMNRELSNQATGKDAKVPEKWFAMGEQDFKKIIKVGAFADHTLLIKELISYDAETNESSYKPVLITAPRRFGKTINLSMVKYFLEIQRDEKGQPIKGQKDLEKPVKDTANYKLFAGMNIMEHTALVDEHFGRHPVIYLDFNGADFSNPDDEKLGQYRKAFMHIRTVLRNAIIQHQYLKGKLDEEGSMFFSLWCDLFNYQKIEEHIVRQSLLCLVNYLFTHFKRKVFILVDEYDAIPREAVRMFTRDEAQSANKTFMNILGSVIKESNECVQGVMMTGVSFLGGIGSDAIKNLERCSFLKDHRFVKFYGFTESEVERIADVYVQVGGDEATLEHLRHGYDGYESQGGEKMYSLWSVGNFLETGLLGNFWANTGEFYHLLRMLKEPAISVHMAKLLNGHDLHIALCDTVTVDAMMDLNETMKSSERPVYDRDLLFSMMLEEGYLTMSKQEDNFQTVKVRLPNQEIHKYIWELTLVHYKGNWWRMFSTSSRL